MAQKNHSTMTDEQLLSRVLVDPAVCRGRPHIRGTRIQIAVILDALSEGLSPREVLDHYPDLDADDLRAAVAYACKLARENGGLAVLDPRRGITESLQPR
jgi:uncharacterized protein (DUF433 family)